MAERNKAAPIALFVHKREYHTRQTVEALLANELADQSELFVFSDGPKDESSAAAVRGVREYLKGIKGFKNIIIHEREKNVGLASNIIDGITRTVNEHGRVIILEDDLVTSPYFLRFMNDALDFYEHEEKVISIHGYMFPLGDTLPETFFLLGADCWGWATWKRGWNFFEADGEKLLKEVKKRNLQRVFDINDSLPYFKMLEDQTKGLNDSWAIRWYASAFLKNKLTLYPGRSLIKNIGMDGSGRHCGTTKMYDSEISLSPISINQISFVENESVKKQIKKYSSRTGRSVKQRLIGKIKRISKKLLSKFKT